MAAAGGSGKSERREEAVELMFHGHAGKSCMLSAGERIGAAREPAAMRG
jgi:hypothetical protein